MIAAAFYPKDVIVPLSDFKTNKYANLIGQAPSDHPEFAKFLLEQGGRQYFAHARRRAAHYVGRA